MSADSLDAMLARIVENQQLKVEIGLAPGMERPLPTPEQARLAGEAFSQHPPEPDALASVLFLSAGAMTLKDVLNDTFSSSEDEEEEKPRKKDNPPDDER